MSYFRELPDLLYQSNLLHKTSSREYVRVKNLFRRVKLQDWLTDKASFFDKYTVLDTQRPDTVAEIFYGQADLDWIVVLTAGITNIKDEWPLSNYDLYKYVENKYGLTEMNNIHHYETIEVRDAKGRLILPAGQVVDQNFTIKPPYDASTAANFYVGVRPQSNNVDYKTVSGDINPVTGVSNYEYETIKNEEKREIELMKPGYLQQFLNDMRNLMYYEESSRTINSRLLLTDNSRLIGP